MRSLRAQAWLGSQDVEFDGISPVSWAPLLSFFNECTGDA